MSLTLLTKPQQPVTGNKWSAVHMPVIYELQTDLSPNTAGPSSGVSSYNSNGGYLRVDLASIGTVNELEFIKIVAPNAPEYEGVHQVIQKEAGDIYTLDIAYDSGTINWSGSAFTKFYSNYYMNVRVYVGLVPGHPLASDKPVELAAELRLLPDSTGKATFSVHEVLKSYVKTVNNREDTGIIGDVDPYNDIDFFTNFYISYAESYDVSNGYTLSNFTTGYTTDAFTGNGVNAHLKFRNLQGTFLTDYMNNKFLTLFAIPVLFACSEETPLCFQDVSIPLGSVSNIKFKQEYYSNGTKITEILTDIPEQGDGVYRIPLTSANCSYDRVDVSLFGNGVDVQEFSNFDSGTAWEADVSGNPTVQLSSNTIGVPGNSKYGAVGIVLKEGSSASIPYKYVVDNVPGSGWIMIVTLSLLDGSGALIAGSEETLSGVTASGTYTGVYNITAPEDAYYYAFRASMIMTAPVGGVSGDITFENSEVEGNIPYSEVKTFDIDCGCANQEMRLVWVNNLGGLDYWNFTAQKTYGVDIMRTEQVQLNKLLTDWVDGSTIRKEVRRESSEFVTARSQHLTLDQLQAIMYIRSSVLVQRIFSAAQKRTVLIDNSSFEAYSDGDKLYSIQFRFRYTDDIPVQSV